MDAAIFPVNDFGPLMKGLAIGGLQASSTSSPPTSPSAAASSSPTSNGSR